MNIIIHGIYNIVVCPLIETVVCNLLPIKVNHARLQPHTVVVVFFGIEEIYRYFIIISDFVVVICFNIHLVAGGRTYKRR